MDGEAKLDAFIARLRSMKNIAAEAAREAAPLVEQALRANASAGRDPDGEAWAPTKDGKRPLARAAGAISVIAKGSLVEIILAGHHVYHQRAKSKSLPQRRVIPDGGAVPAIVVDAMREGCRRAFRRFMGGA